MHMGVNAPGQDEFFCCIHHFCIWVGQVLTENAGCKVTGLEIDEQACKVAQGLLWRVFHGDVETLDLEKFLTYDGYDVILCLDVLEHMRDPWKFLHRSTAWLAPGGYLIATIPNMAHASVLLELLDGKFTYRELGLLDRNHLRFFTLTSIEQMFLRTGYKIDFIDRNCVELKYVELNADLKSFPPEVLTFVQSLPEATTYQFIVKASLSS